MIGNGFLRIKATLQDRGLGHFKRLRGDRRVLNANWRKVSQLLLDVHSYYHHMEPPHIAERIVKLEVPLKPPAWAAFLGVQGACRAQDRLVGS